MFILFSIFRGLEFCYIKVLTINKNSELNVFKNIKFVDEISNY